MTISIHHDLRRCPRVASAAILASVLVFAALILLAMRAYPGGAAWDPATRGSDFWLNYLCDLERGVALDGEPNAGAALARVAVLVLALGFAALFGALPRLFPVHVRLGRAIRWLGCTGALGAASVGVLPNDRFGDVHVYAILAGAVPGLAAVARWQYWPSLARACRCGPLPSSAAPW
jgi:hypothetical protein